MKKQSKYLLYGVLIFVALLVGAKWINSTPAVNSIQGAELTLSENNWSFGEIPMSEGDVTHSVTLTNESDLPITITSMETSCMCTSAQIIHANGSESAVKNMAGHTGSTYLSEVIEVGESASLLVTFDPNTHGPNATGRISRDVMLKTNSADQPEIEFSFSGNVIK
jgi:hypothetical protein